MTRTLILLLLLAGLFCPVLAAPIALTDDPMVIGGGARPIGMGRAFSAVADDADAPFINPAGLAGLKGPQLMTMFTNLLGEVYYTEYAGAMPTTFGTLGIGYVNTGVSRVTVPVGSSFVYADYHDTLLLLSYGTPLSRFFFYGRNLYAGLNAKIFSRGWTGGYTESASGFNLDLGLKYVLTPYLTFGLNRQNFLPMSLGGVVKLSSGAEEAIAGVTKLGVAVKPIPWGGKVLFAYDVDLPAQSGRPVTMHFGTEWKVSPNLTVRGGLDQSVDAAAASGTSWNPAFGASTELGGFRVDLAHHPYYNDPALANNYISFSYQGAPWYALSGEIR